MADNWSIKNSCCLLPILIVQISILRRPSPSPTQWPKEGIRRSRWSGCRYNGQMKIRKCPKKLRTNEGVCLRWIFKSTKSLGQVPLITLQRKMDDSFFFYESVVELRFFCIFLQIQQYSIKVCRNWLLINSGVLDWLQSQ